MTQRAIDDYVYGGEPEAPECPPEAEYTLMFLGPDRDNPIVMGESFDGKEPEPTLVLDFKIDAEQPQPGSVQEEWQHFDIPHQRYTPKLGYFPDLPDYTGKPYNPPKLYLLGRALNGGTPIPIPTAISEKTGKFYFVGLRPSEVLALLEPFIRRRFRAVVSPSDRGYPRITNPMPLIATGMRRGRGQQQAALPAAAAAAAAGGEPDPDPFVQDPEGGL